MRNPHYARAAPSDWATKVNTYIAPKSEKVVCINLKLDLKRSLRPNELGDRNYHSLS